jgi:hypothetical protein
MSYLVICARHGLATVRRRKARMYFSIAVHGCLDCYAYLPCEAEFR